MAHHFNNELCGFAKSFAGILSKVLCQYPNPEVGITPLGNKVISALLDNTFNNRILVDLKHMNPKSRYMYYDLLYTKYIKDNIPIIISHGAINGKLSFKNNKHNKVVRSGFNTEDINFF